MRHILTEDWDDFLGAGDRATKAFQPCLRLLGVYGWSDHPKLRQRSAIHLSDNYRLYVESRLGSHATELPLDLDKELLS